MSEPSLLSELRDGVLTLTLNRPDKLNAIDAALGEALLNELQASATRDDVRVVRLRGSGRAFCAGRDVGAPPTDEDLVLVQAVARAIVATPKPVLAAVHGWTVGAGLEWMLDADIVVAADNTRFKLPEASLGVFVTGGLSLTLPAAIGPMRAKALVLTGEAFDANDALRWGLVWKLVPADQLDAASSAIASTLTALAPPVAARFKRVFNEFGLARFEQAIEAENAAQRSFAAS